MIHGRITHVCDKCEKNMCKSQYPEWHRDPLEMCANLAQSLSYEFSRSPERAEVFRDCITPFMIFSEMGPFLNMFILQQPVLVTSRASLGSF